MELSIVNRELKRSCVSLSEWSLTSTSTFLITPYIMHAVLTVLGTIPIDSSRHFTRRPSSLAYSPVTDRWLLTAKSAAKGQI